MFVERNNRKTRRRLHLIANNSFQFTHQGSVADEQVFYLRSLMPNGIPPTGARIDCLRMFEFNQVLDDLPNAAAKFSAKGSTQILDLLGKVLPIDRFVRAGARSAKRLGLLPGPGKKVF